jgi:hypothetical protein
MGDGTRSETILLDVRENNVPERLVMEGWAIQTSFCSQMYDSLRKFRSHVTTIPPHRDSLRENMTANMSGSERPSSSVPPVHPGL